jgi:hypothetical protein
MTRLTCADISRKSASKFFESYSYLLDLALVISLQKILKFGKDFWEGIPPPITDHGSLLNSRSQSLISALPVSLKFTAGELISPRRTAEEPTRRHAVEEPRN